MPDVPRKPDDFNAYLTANHTYTLRIHASGKETCTLTVPQDPRTMIMIQADMTQNTFSDLEQPFPKTFRGNLSLRIASIPDQVEHGPCRDLMRNAFFTLDLKDATVEVAREDEARER